MTIADHCTPPKAGKINVLTLAAATASTAQDSDQLASGTRYLTAVCNAEWYILFTSNGKSDSTSLPAPVIATTGVDATVDGRCWGPIAAGVEFHRELTPDDRYFRAISTAGGVLRWYLSSGVGA